MEKLSELNTFQVKNDVIFHIINQLKGTVKEKWKGV